MQAADVFCLPSIREGCPNVILEALSCGRPVVATTVGGIPELIEPHNGVLVPPSEPAALADALDQALGREWDSAEIRRHASRFSWETSAAALYGAACKALAAGAAPALAPPQRETVR
jgi:glycosyltransferase involved in cell wall biosynthesis